VDGGALQDYILELSRRTEANDEELARLRLRTGQQPRAPEKLASLAVAAGAVAAVSDLLQPGHHTPSAAPPPVPLLVSAPAVRTVAAGGAVTIRHEDPAALQQENAELLAKLAQLERRLKVAPAKPGRAGAAPTLAPAPGSLGPAPPANAAALSPDGLGAAASDHVIPGRVVFMPQPSVSAGVCPLAHQPPGTLARLACG
jgi:hypothetical protein